MKKLLNLGLALISFAGIIACDDDRYDNEILGTEKVKIDSVQFVNDTMAVHSVQSIRTYSTYASGCNNFYAYDYVKNGLTRNVTAYQYVTSGPCTQALHTKMNQFNFQPAKTGIYTFKFWQGDNTWLTKTIVVQ